MKTKVCAIYFDLIGSALKNPFLQILPYQTAKFVNVQGLVFMKMPVPNMMDFGIFKIFF